MQETSIHPLSIKPRFRLLRNGKDINSDKNRQNKTYKLQKANKPAAFSDNEVLNNYLQIVENMQTVCKKEGIQIIGFTGVSAGQGTSLLLSVISYLISEEITDAYSYFFAPENEEKKRILRYDGIIKKGVCLIDANFRKPSLHKIFGIENGKGLCSLLNASDMPEVAGQFIFNSNFELLSAGYGCENMKPPINWGGIEPLLNKLKTRKKYIFIDLPPILLYADSLRLCKQCDAVSIVVKANETRRELVIETKKALEKIGVKVLGGVLTNRKFFIPDWLYRKL
ncbi:MAG: hypothetical protein ACE5I1_31540 [bacterium]